MDENLINKIKDAHTLNNPEYIKNIKYTSIRHLFSERISRLKDKEFICYYDEDRNVIRMNYGEFSEKVNRLSDFLLSSDCKKETRISSFSQNHIDTVVLYFACWNLGIVVVPININEDENRISYILENSDSKMIFTRSAYIDKLKFTEIKTVLLDNFNFNDYDNLPPQSGDFDYETEAMIVYTSGTTGNPKGVVLTQLNLLADADSISSWHNLNEGDAMMCVLPIHHVNGTIVTLMTPFYYGGRVVLNSRFSTEYFFEVLSSEKIKIVSVVPTLLQYLIQADNVSPDLNLNYFSHLICGAGPLTCEIARKFENKFKLKIIHGYGLSETTCYSCFIPVNLDDIEHFRWQNKFGFPSIGVPVKCNDMDIHNEAGELAGENNRGEIVIRGLNVMKYYFNNEIANSKAFEFSWFRSGDEGFYKMDEKGDKYFFITGRIKEIIIRGGVNIAPLEIDEVLCSIDLVKSGIAVGFDNDWYGEEVGALIILKDNLSPEDPDNEKQILSECRKRLSFYKAPKVVVFTDKIPVTSTGKYQRNKVKYLFERYRSVQFKN